MSIWSIKSRPSLFGIKAQATSLVNFVKVDNGVITFYCLDYNFTFTSTLANTTEIFFCIYYDNAGIFEGMSAYATKITTMATILNDDGTTLLELPCPSKYNGVSTTLVENARNTKGEFVAKVIRSNVAKVEMSWNYLTIDQYSQIAKVFEEDYGGSFVHLVCFFNATIGCFDIRQMYVGDRTFDTAEIALINNMPVGYQSVPLHLIEL